MALWRQDYSYHSPIPEILEKEGFTLEELLDEEGLIQETKSANGKLLEYLSQSEQISSLLTYVVQPASEGQPYFIAISASPSVPGVTFHTMSPSYAH